MPYKDPERRKAYSAQHVRRYWTYYRYGLKADDYDRMVEEQGGVCAICGSPPTDEKRRRLQVDHDHETGTIRALLCFKCNAMIGLARESADILEVAAAYLNAHEEVMP